MIATAGCANGVPSNYRLILMQGLAAKWSFDVVWGHLPGIRDPHVTSSLLGTDRAQRVLTVSRVWQG